MGQVKGLVRGRFQGSVYKGGFRVWYGVPNIILGTNHRAQDENKLDTGVPGCEPTCELWKLRSFPQVVLTRVHMLNVTANLNYNNFIYNLLEPGYCWLHHDDSYCGQKWRYAEPRGILSSEPAP